MTKQHEYNFNDIKTMYHCTKSAPFLDLNAVRYLWDNINSDPMARIIFRSIDVDSPGSMGGFVNNPENIIMTGFYDNKLCVFGWLNHVRAKTAHIHFTTFQHSYRGVNKLTCEKIIQEMLFTKGGPDKGGEYLFNCLIGLTPISNKLACRFVRSIGFVESGIVKQGDIDPLTNEPVDCMMTYCTRDVLLGIDRYRDRLRFMEA